MFNRLIQTTLGLALALATTMASHAEEVAAPQGDPILTISGDIAVTNVGDTLVFDRETLMALEAVSFETTTIWTEGSNVFEGVSLHRLATLLGVDSGRFRATAINDYAVEIPLTDAVPGGAIIAYAMNGAPMSVRDKGPLWVVYPYDSSSAYRTEVVYARSIWQLDRIEFVK